MDSTITIKPLRPLIPPTPQRRVEGMSATEEKSERTPTEQTQALTPGELQQVQQLKQRDRQVRSHELAHKAIAGQYARGAPSYEYQIGPDGRRYAVGGEVSIDISKANDPRETLRKAEVIRRAAMAPANPSMQDRQVAMQASTMAAEARHELRLQEQQTDSAAAHLEKAQKPATQTPDPGVPATSVRHAMTSIYRVLSSSQETSQIPFELIA